LIDEVRPSPPKTSPQICAEWNAAASSRHRQIASGKDLSFAYVLRPAILDLLDESDQSQVLDVGCGTGELTREVALRAESVFAVDMSEASIEIARSVCGGFSNIEFRVGAIESLDATPRAFSTAIAAMTLMTAPDLPAMAAATAALLTPGAALLATLTHPCFWPRYWGYEQAPWFEYGREIFIEAPFHISLDETDCVTTHVHRPLATYVKVFEGAGFRLVSLRELKPGPDVERLYPKPWEFPRFLAIKWQRFR
jgi:SAM-dependent methyltransferase